MRTYNLFHNYEGVAEIETDPLEGVALFEQRFGKSGKEVSCRLQRM